MAKIALAKEDKLILMVMAWAVGMALWGVQGYVFGYLKIRWVTYGYAGMSIWYLIRNFQSILAELREAIRIVLKDKIFLLILGLGVGLALICIFPSGLPSKDGVWVFDINQQDGMYHLAQVRSIARQFPPMEPGMAGVRVTNYHYWSDLVLAEIVRIIPIPLTNLYYQYFPLLVALLSGVVVYCLGKEWGKEKGGRLSVFFYFFSGEAAYLLIFLIQKRLTFGMQQLDNGATLFTNMPRAVAQLILIAGILAVWRWLAKNERRWGWVMALLFGVSIGFKVYTGIMVAIGLVGLGLWLGLKKKYDYWWPILLTGLIQILVFFPNNSGSGGFLWQPWSWPRHYFASGEAASLQWHLAEQVFLEKNNAVRLLLLHGKMFLSFLAIVWGTRILGFFGGKKFFEKVGTGIGLFVAIQVVIATVLATFFVQQSGAFENFNFLAVTGVYLSLILSLWMSTWAKKMNWFIWFIVALTIPRALFQAGDYLDTVMNKNDKAWLFSTDQMSLIEKIGKLPETGMILTDPNDWLGKYTPYLASFNDKQYYFHGLGIFRAHSVNTEAREIILEELMTSKKADEFYNRAKNEGISYAYLLVNHPLVKMMEEDGRQFEFVGRSEKYVLIGLR